MTESLPSTKKVLEILSRDLNFDSLRAKYPGLTERKLKELLKKAAGFCPDSQRLPDNKKSDSKPPKGTWIANIDGASRGNPGPAGAGVWISTSRGFIELKRSLGRVTNNVAEYEALLLAMSAASGEGINNLEVRSDSELLVKQMNGSYRVKNPALAARFKEAQNIEKKFKSFKIIHVPREMNAEADRLANEAIDESAPV